MSSRARSEAGTGSIESDAAPSSGSCHRCKRTLDASAAKVEGHWYGNAECARGEGCPLETSRPVPEEDLWVMPRRHLAKRRPIELRTSGDAEEPPRRSALPFKS